MIRKPGINDVDTRSRQVRPGGDNVQPAALVVGGGTYVRLEVVRGQDFDELTAMRIVCSL